MSSRDKWKIDLRDDQAKFVIATMQYVIERCEERISPLKSEAFNTFLAHRSKEFAEEILEHIENIIG